LEAGSIFVLRGKGGEYLLSNIPSSWRGGEEAHGIQNGNLTLVLKEFNLQQFKLLIKTLVSGTH
jgi:hypothetical protein